MEDRSLFLTGGIKEFMMVTYALKFYRDRYLPMLREHIDEFPYGLPEVDDMERTINRILKTVEEGPEVFDAR